LRWKLQIGFIVVTAVTTLFNRFLAAHELQGLTQLYFKATQPMPLQLCIMNII
jgi:hypothetical protein